MTQPVTQPRIKLAEFVRNVHVVTAPMGWTVDDALNPVNWAHVALQMKPRDRIELWAEDRAWFAELLVVKASRLDVHCAVLSRLDLGVKVRDEAVVSITGYHADYGGPVDMWRVIRDADGQAMTSGLTEDEAEQWIKDHVEARRRPAAPVVEPAASGDSAVVIPDNWRSLSWQDRRSLASKVTDKPIHNGTDANAAIEAELKRRAEPVAA